MFNIVVASVVASKEKMQHHIDTVITKRIEHIEQVMRVNSQLPYNAMAQIGSGDQSKIEKAEVLMQNRALTECSS